METLTSEDRTKLHGFLGEHKKDKQDYIRILSYDNIDIPLKKLFPEEDPVATRSRIKAEQEQQVAEITRLQGLIMENGI